VLTDQRTLIARYAASQCVTNSRNRSSGNSQIFGPRSAIVRQSSPKNELTERAYPTHLSNFTCHLMELRRRRLLPSLADLRNILRRLMSVAVIVRLSKNPAGFSVFVEV
jgi:hypothetical protein